MDVTPGLGGPLGRRVRPGDSPVLTGASLAPLLLLSVVPVLVAVTRQGFCLGHGWGDKFMIWRGCSSDLTLSVPLVGDGGVTAYLTGGSALPHPPLAGALMALVDTLAPQGADTLATQRWVLGLWVVVMAALMALLTWLVATAVEPGAERARAASAGSRAWQVALAPVAAWSVLLGPDLVAVTLATLGGWAWGRRRPLLAGIALGVATLVAPVALVVAAVLVALEMTSAPTRPGAGATDPDGAAGAGEVGDLDGARDRAATRAPTRSAARAGSRGPLWTLVLGLVAGLVGGALPFATAPGVLTTALGDWWRELATPGSTWYVMSALGHPVTGPAAATFTLIGWVLAVALAGILAVGARSSRPPAAPLVLVALVVALLLAKSFPVQASLWLVPFVALAGIRWRDHLVWAACEAVHLLGATLFAYAGQDPNRALPGGWYAAAIGIRVAGLAWLGWRAWLLADAEPTRAGGAHAAGRGGGRAAGRGGAGRPVGVDDFGEEPGGGYPVEVVPAHPGGPGPRPLP